MLYNTGARKHFYRQLTYIFELKMSRNKEPAKKILLVKADRTRKRAPVWVFAKTNRKVRDSPKSRRSWRTKKLF